jgi:hypothetical protein
MPVQARSTNSGIYFVTFIGFKWKWLFDLSNELANDYSEYPYSSVSLYYEKLLHVAEGWWLLPVRGLPFTLSEEAFSVGGKTPAGSKFMIVSLHTTHYLLCFPS